MRLGKRSRMQGWAGDRTLAPDSCAAGPCFSQAEAAVPLAGRKQQAGRGSRPSDRARITITALTGWISDEPHELPEAELDLAAALVSEHVFNLLNLAEEADLGEFARAARSLSAACDGLARFADAMGQRTGRDPVASSRLRQETAPSLRRLADDFEQSAVAAHRLHRAGSG